MGMLLTAPGWAGKDDHVLVASEPGDGLEAVASEPEDFVRDTIEFGIVLCAFHRLGVLFDGEDALPATGACKGDSISAYACKSIDNDGLILRR
jgi:hypothetical protein